MNWISLAILGLVLTIVARHFLRLHREGRRGQELGDKDVLRTAIANWDSFVLKNAKTMRSVKRFANHARFMVHDESDDLIEPLVGLIALDEIGLMDHPLNPVDNDSDLEKWKQNVSENLGISGSNSGTVTVTGWLNSLTLAHWNRYQILAAQGRS